MLIFKRTGTAEVQNTSSSLEFGRNLGNLFQLENNPIYSNFWFFDSGNWLSLKQVCVVPIVGSCPQPTHLLTPGDLHHDRTRLPYDRLFILIMLSLMMVIIISQMLTSYMELLYIQGVFFSLVPPLKYLSTKKLIQAWLGVSRPIYVNVDSPNLVFRTLTFQEYFKSFASSYHFHVHEFPCHVLR